MARIYQRKLPSGREAWYLTHGTGDDRQRFRAGDTKEQAEETLRQFNRRLALHGKPPGEITVEAAVQEYVDWLQVNRSHSTHRRYARVLKTFVECFLHQFHPSVKLLRGIKPAHLEEYKRRRLVGDISE